MAILSNESLSNLYDKGDCLCACVFSIGGNTAAVREQLARIGLSNGNVDLTELLRRANAKGVRGRKIERQALQGLLGGGAASIGGLQ